MQNRIDQLKAMGIVLTGDGIYDILGCSEEFWLSHFRSLYTSEMNDHLFMMGLIHLSHVIPQAFFDLEAKHLELHLSKVLSVLEVSDYVNVLLKLDFNWRNMGPLFDIDNHTMGTDILFGRQIHPALLWYDDLSMENWLMLHLQRKQQANMLISMAIRKSVRTKLELQHPPLAEPRVRFYASSPPVSRPTSEPNTQDLVVQNMAMIGKIDSLHKEYNAEIGNLRTEIDNLRYKNHLLKLGSHVNTPSQNSWTEASLISYNALMDSILADKYAVSEVDTSSGDDLV